MKILDRHIHGILDYAAATALIIAPLVLGFSGITLWFSVAAGAGLILYSLITDYNPSIAKVISFRTHLIFDTLAGLTFVIAPFVFGWGGVVAAYYVVMGAGVLMVVALTHSETLVETV